MQIFRELSSFVCENFGHKSLKSFLFLTTLLCLLWPGVSPQKTNNYSALESQQTLAEEIAEAEKAQTDLKTHRRQKRLIWITEDGRLALPPGTTLTITPTISMPLVRHPPKGFLSNVTISFPVNIDFDKLGLTDNENPLGDLPPIFARSFYHETGRMLGNYVAQYLSYRRKRDVSYAQSREDSDNMISSMPELPNRFKHIFHGGERILLYTVVEDLLSTFGVDGKACLLRTICEVHSRDISNYGVIGEMLKLFLTVTKSPFFEHVPEYVEAQKIGEGRLPPQECFPYFKECPKSLFKPLQNHNYKKKPPGEYEKETAIEISKPANDTSENDISYLVSM